MCNLENGKVETYSIASESSSTSLIKYDTGLLEVNAHLYNCATAWPPMVLAISDTAVDAKAVLEKAKLFLDRKFITYAPDGFEVFWLTWIFLNF